MSTSLICFPYYNREVFSITAGLVILRNVICRPPLAWLSTPLPPNCKCSVPCLVTLRPLCKIFLAAPGADPEFLLSDTGQIFIRSFLRLRGLIQNFLLSDTGQIFIIYFWPRIMRFGVVWLWPVMIRQFRIHLNRFQNCCVHSGPLARSAAHPRVPRGLKHGTANASSVTAVLSSSSSCLIRQQLYCPQSTD